LLTVSTDPGAKSGAWAILDHNNKFIACGDVPHIDGEVQTEILFLTLAHWTTGHDVRCVIEKVHAFSGQGVSSSFLFGQAYGSLLAVANRISNTGTVHKVTPQAWKKYHNLIKTEKKASLGLVQNKYPEAGLKLVKHHNMADAILIGEYLNGL
jgi:crossover junction endodeoxyribonuclease RuvC